MNFLAFSNTEMCVCVCLNGKYCTCVILYMMLNHIILCERTFYLHHINSIDETQDMKLCHIQIVPVKWLVNTEQVWDDEFEFAGQRFQMSHF